MSSVIERIGADLSVPQELIDEALKLAHVRFRKIRVPKRSGGYRTIVQPAAELKLVQEWLLVNIFSKLPISKVATAFYTGASIVKNADAHKDSLYSVRVDLTGFFPSIRNTDLAQAITTARSALPNWVAEPEVASLITTACFDRDNRLPIGYSTSPCIANAVMVGFDTELLNIISSDSTRFGRAILTRYADDFVFSTEKRGACHAFVDVFRELISKTKSPRLAINEAKTRYMSRPGGSTLVTGLRINQDGVVRVHPTYRDHVRLLLKLYSLGKLNTDEHQRLLGHLAYVEHADPRLFTRLSYRYYDEIALLRGSNP